MQQIVIIEVYPNEFACNQLVFYIVTGIILIQAICLPSDGSISASELVRRVKELERLVAASSLINWRGVGVAPRDLRDLYRDHERSRKLLMRVAREPAAYVLLIVTTPVYYVQAPIAQ